MNSSSSFQVPPLPLPLELGIICAAPALGGWYRAQTMDYDAATGEVWD